jgi:hypothetical protein
LSAADATRLCRPIAAARTVQITPIPHIKTLFTPLATDAMAPSEKEETIASEKRAKTKGRSASAQKFSSRDKVIFIFTA